MSAAVADAVRATFADLEAVPPHLVAEIVDGALETRPRPRPRHAVAETSLVFSLVGPFQRGRGGPGGWVFMMEPELYLGSDVVVPDLARWRAERMAVELEAAFIATPPDWVCEILSPSTARLDRGAKRRIHAGAGIGHLWLLDPVGRTEGFRADRRAVAAARHDPARRGGAGRALRRGRFPHRRPVSLRRAAGPLRDGSLTCQ